MNLQVNVPGTAGKGQINPSYVFYLINICFPINQLKVRSRHTTLIEAICDVSQMGNHTVDIELRTPSQTKTLDTIMEVFTNLAPLMRDSLEFEFNQKDCSFKITLVREWPKQPKKGQNG